MSVWAVGSTILSPLPQPRMKTIWVFTFVLWVLGLSTSVRLMTPPIFNQKHIHRFASWCIETWYHTHQYANITRIFNIVTRLVSRYMSLHVTLILFNRDSLTGQASEDRKCVFGDKWFSINLYILVEHTQKWARKFVCTFQHNITWLCTEIVLQVATESQPVHEICL